jgi:peptidyl-prolyl cis-trans isomerase SurA
VLKRFVVFAVLAAACMAVGCQRNAAPGPDVWAMVNGHPILEQQVERFYRSQYNRPQHPSPEEAAYIKLDILDDLINNELLLEQAQKLGLQATDSEVEQRFAELKAPYTDVQFEKELKQRGLTVDELKNELRERVSIDNLIRREITSKIKVSEQEIEAAYERNRADYDVAEPEYHVAQIVVTPYRDAEVRNQKNNDATTPAQAVRKIHMLLAKLRAGANFATLARDYSEDAVTASTGGDLGFISASSLNQGDPALKRAVLALKPGQISGILHVKKTYRIIKLIAVIKPGQRPLSDPSVQQEIRQTLRQRKEQLLHSAYLTTLRDQAHITNYLAQRILAEDGPLPATTSASGATPALETAPPSTDFSAPPGTKSSTEPLRQPKASTKN